MGMPISIEIAEEKATQHDIDDAFRYFQRIDGIFSTYKEESEISRLNRGEIMLDEVSDEVKEVFDLSEKTRQETQGYFDIHRSDGTIDPSGMVKGWAIFNAAKLLERRGFRNFCVEAGGDIQTSGVNAKNEPWRIGIQNPFKQEQEIIKVVNLRDHEGMATSGTSVRGQHIYNPHSPHESIHDMVSLTVIGPNIYEADRFATAAFAMGKNGIHMIEERPGLEGYMIDAEGVATMTSGFTKHIHIQDA